MAVTRNLPDENSTPPVSGADYVEDVADTVKALWDAVALVPTSVTDSGNDYTIEVSPALDADVKEGMVFYVEPSASATGSARMRVTDSNPYYDLVKANGDALGSGDFDTGTVYVVLFFDGTFRIVSAAADGGGGGSVDRQVFTSSGTWNKPGSGTVARIEVWAGGGGGDSANQAGGGGAYNSKLIPLDDLGSSETVTVGAGGAVGSAGGNSSLGSHVQAFGGGSANGSGDGGGGGGGGQLSAGGEGGLDGGDGGGPFGGAGGSSSPGEDGNSGGGGDGADGGDGMHGGAGGGGGGNNNGGDSLHGGAGGGAGNSGLGGSSVYGGDGGDAQTAGSAPAGGGGGDASGARGEVRVTVW